MFNFFKKLFTDSIENDLGKLRLKAEKKTEKNKAIVEEKEYIGLLINIQDKINFSIKHGLTSTGLLNFIQVREKNRQRIIALLREKGYKVKVDDTFLIVSWGKNEN